jgi:hypothetical protein
MNSDTIYIREKKVTLINFPDSEEAERVIDIRREMRWLYKEQIKAEKELESQ